MSHDGKSISLVMPCRNEGRHLGQVTEGLPSFIDQVIIVSNRSTDDTWDVLQGLAETDPRIIPMKDDQVGSDGIGYGYAHMTGIARAESDWVVCADCDGTYPVEVTPDVIGWCEETGRDFASCSRYPDPDIPVMLRLGVTVLNIEMLVLYGLRISDSLSGMWVFKREIVPLLGLSAGDWNLSPQIKLNAWATLGERFGEYKVTQRRRLGETKQHYLRTGLSHLIWIMRARRSIMGTRRRTKKQNEMKLKQEMLGAREE